MNPIPMNCIRHTKPISHSDQNLDGRQVLSKGEGKIIKDENFPSLFILTRIKETKGKLPITQEELLSLSFNSRSH